MRGELYTATGAAKSKAKVWSPSGGATPKAPTSSLKRDAEGGGEGEAGGSSTKKSKPAAPKADGAPPSMAALSADSSPTSQYQTPAGTPERGDDPAPVQPKPAAARQGDGAGAGGMPRAGAYAAYARRALAACLVAAAFVSAARAHDDDVASSLTKWGKELTRRSTACALDCLPFLSP